MLTFASSRVRSAARRLAFIPRHTNCKGVRRLFGCDPRRRTRTKRVTARLPSPKPWTPREQGALEMLTIEGERERNRMFQESAWLVKATGFRTLLTAERRAHRVRKRAHAHTQKGRKEAVRSAWRSGEEGKPRRWSPEADGRSCTGAPHQPRVPRERHLVLRGLLVWAGAALPLRVTAGSSCQSRGPSESLGTSERVGASLAPIASNVAALRCASAEHA